MNARHPFDLMVPAQAVRRAEIDIHGPAQAIAFRGAICASEAQGMRASMVYPCLSGMICKPTVTPGSIFPTLSLPFISTKAPSTPSRSGPISS